jgi:hypothetical protein
MLTAQQMDTKAENHHARLPWAIGSNMIFVAKRKSAKIDDHHGSRKMPTVGNGQGATFIARDSLPGGESVCVTY